VLFAITVTVSFAAPAAPAAAPASTSCSNESEVIGPDDGAGAALFATFHTLANGPKSGVQLTAAGVGLAAVLISNNNAQDQAVIMQGQLGEMQRQRDFSIAQMRARFRREPIAFQPIDANGLPLAAGGQITGWAFNPRWFNVGSTAARNFF
jgi:hypothetical protein